MAHLMNPYYILDIYCILFHPTHNNCYRSLIKDSFYIVFSSIPIVFMLNTMYKPIHKKI